MVCLYRCILIFIICFVVSNGSDVSRPRGVSLSRAALYISAKDFTCLDGSATIPFHQVNDDYCDCFDGSDEPGTAACINGIFHCTNAGHRPQNIPSSRVNDGVCDCCDATDEYGVPGTCADTCDELGREARAEAQRRADLLKSGSQMRLELIQKGNKKRSEMAERLKELEKDMEEANSIVIEKEMLKSQAESLENEVLQKYRNAEEEARQLEEVQAETADSEDEAEEFFRKFDSNEDGIVSQDEIMTRSVFDRNKDGAVSADEAKYFLAENGEVDLEKFVREAWPLMKPFLMIQEGLFQAPAKTEEHGVHENLDGNDDAEKISDLEAEDLDRDEHQEEPDAEETEVTPAYDQETQKLVDAAQEARQHHTNAERTLREINSEINKLKESLEIDYGPQQEFTTLSHECIEYTDKEYVYKLCMFDHASQHPKNGGGEIRLGSWGQWTGGDEHPYTAMLYSNGASCWNGPNRSTRVNIDCGLETKIITVTEPSRCEYLFEIITPAGCDETQSTIHSLDHDEL